MTKHKSLLSITEARKRLGGSGRTKIYELIGSGKLTARKLGRRTFLEADQVDELIESLPSGLDAGTIRISSRCP
jgi:excisionase family DNA binding protein